MSSSLNNNRLTGTVPAALASSPAVSLMLGGSNHYCPIIDYSSWAGGNTDFQAGGECEACADFTCQNGGVCSGGVNELFQCQCQKGFSGVNCESKAASGGKLKTGAKVGITLLVVLVGGGAFLYYHSKVKGLHCFKWHRAASGGDWIAIQNQE